MYQFFVPVVISLNLIACGGGGSKSSDKENIKTGVFLDSPVANLDYKTASLSGVTNAKGEFQYKEGEVITFALGDLVFPSVNANAVVTPEDFSPNKNARDPIVRNALRLL